MGWLSGWSNRTQLTISNTNIDSDLSNFPILVYLSTSSGTGSTDISYIFDELGSDANRLKIAVTTSDGETECYVEIERWDDANECAWLWIKIPSATTASSTTVYLYFDATHADNTDHVGDIDSVSGHNTWNSAFKLSSRMRDATTSTIKDSTSNGHDGTKVGANEPNEVTGKVDKGQSFDKNNDKITIANHADFDFSGAFTLEVELNPTSTDGQRCIYRYDPTSEDGYYLGTHLDKYTFRTYIGGVSKAIYSNANVDTTDYSHVAGVRDASGGMTLVINGVVQTDTDTNNGAIDSSDPVYLGVDRGGNYPLGGIMDEVRISNTNRSVAWLKATYHSSRDNLIAYSVNQTVDMVVAESFDADDSLENIFNITLSESFGANDTLGCQYTSYPSLVESFGADDTLAIQWNAICELAESFGADDYIITLHSNIYGRHRIAMNHTGNSLRLKFQNNSADQMLWLQDIGLALFTNEKIRQDNYAMNLKSQNIRLKIQNNTSGEVFVLYENGVLVYINEQR